MTPRRCWPTSAGQILQAGRLGCLPSACDAGHRGHRPPVRLVRDGRAAAGAPWRRCQACRPSTSSWCAGKLLGSIAAGLAGDGPAVAELRYLAARYRPPEIAALARLDQLPRPPQRRQY